MTGKTRAPLDPLDIGGFRPRSHPPAPVPAEAGEAARNAGFTTRHAAEPSVKTPRSEVRFSIEITRELREWLKDQARHIEGGTARSVVLTALREMGAPIAEEDILDRRQASPIS